MSAATETAAGDSETRSAKDWALDLASRGLAVFPLRPNSKKPFGGKRWSELMTTDAESIHEWFELCPEMNYGVCGREDHVVIDLDVKDGKDGVTAFNKLHTDQDMEDWVVGETFTVSTPSGGVHLYLKTDKTAGNSHRFPPGIDVRGRRGYVVGPGCYVHDDKVDGPYIVTENTHLKDAPTWVKELLKEGRAKTKVYKEPAFDLDSPESIQRGIEMLKHRDPAIEGMGGDIHTYHTALQLIDLGLSQEVCIEVMNQPYMKAGDETPMSWNQRCEPPWDSWGAIDTLEEKVANAWKYREQQVGSKGGGSAEDAFDGIEKDTQDFEKFANDDYVDEDRPLSAAELAAGDFPRAEHLVQDLVLKGHPNTLDGDGGVGKTQVLLQMAVAVASGEPLFGHEVTQMPVLLVLCEDNYGETKFRLHEACNDADLDLADLPIEVWCRPGKDSALAVVDDKGAWGPEPFYKALSEALKRIGPCFLGLDTNSDVAVLDENKRPPVNTFAKQVLGGLCKQYGCTIFITRHPSKASKEDGSGYAGSTAANAAFRNRLKLSVAKKRGNMTLSVVKSNYGLRGEVELHHTGTVFCRWGTMVDHQSVSDEQDALLAVLAKLRSNNTTVVNGNGNGLKPRDLVPLLREDHGLDLDTSTVKAHLGSLQASNKIHYVPACGGKNGSPATYEVGPNPTSLTVVPRGDEGGEKGVKKVGEEEVSKG